MTTVVDICNQALQLLTSRNKIDQITDGSEEAENCNLAYATVRDWCFSLTNWNFARKTIGLTLLKFAPGTPGTPWGVQYPSPPWLYEYTYPADAIRIFYVISQAFADGKWTGVPSKFVVATDLISTVQTKVILTNQVGALCMYTVAVTDPTVWPAYFSRAVVATLAWTVAGALTQNAELQKFLEETSKMYTDIAIEINRREGLVIDDATPELIMARGLPMLTRRPEQSAIRQKPAEKPQR